MELLIEEKKTEKISYEDILKKMNLKIVDGKLSQYEPSKKNSYFYPQPNEYTQVNKPQVMTREQYINLLVQRINQKKRISQMKPKRLLFNNSNSYNYYNNNNMNTFFKLKF
jgi:hypothetical protein